MKNLFNLTIAALLFLIFIIGCSSADETATVTNTPATSNEATMPEKPIAIQAKTLTKEYDENELAADGKYKDKTLEVSGKVSNIAETLGNVTAQLEGHNAAVSVMCSFDEAEKANVLKLKKGQNATFVGKGDGSTGGLYVGLQNCKIQ